MSEQPLGNLAGYLAQYWQHALSARSENLVNHRFGSNTVQELTSYANWQNGSWDLNFKANHSLALHQIITRNAEEIRGIAEKARNSPENEDISYLLDMARQLQDEVNAAGELQEMLSGR